MKIKIIAVGKIKEQWINSGIFEYKKRQKNLEILEINDGKEEEIVQKILRAIEKEKNNKSSLIVSLSQEGKEISSMDFSSIIKKNISDARDICFIVGGPEGLHKNIKDASNMVLSMSKMTFTHEMARLFLVEQLYRAQTIIENKKYHR